MRTGDKGMAVSRRKFLKGAGVVAASLPVMGVMQQAHAETPPVPTPQPAPALAPITASVTGYQVLSLEEAAFTEALVDHMWPKDHLTPSGTEIGIAAFIDRHLAGAFGQGDRLYMQGPFRKGVPQQGYQLPLTPLEYYRTGMNEVTKLCRQRFNKGFDKLESAERELILKDMSDGKLVEIAFDLKEWFDTLIHPLVERGAFSDPIYGGNRGKAAWRMIGYPGLPAVYNHDIVRYRGKLHPGSSNPKSIEDFS
jgi:gluconate 2-dehydrogenase gamma chain